MQRAARALRRAAFALPALLAPAAPCAAATDYPVKPIRMVVPYAPGGPVDIVARTVGQKLGDALGGTVVIDNRAGANGN
ncbi:MAG TPA: tripartite tricarboxylate transporter substrate binding protein, partial [Burkholderiales bacterium]|nr:tripartite tricarboxylate transporter substrate binding protein [Burkholderiales bacterium]